MSATERQRAAHGQPSMAAIASVQQTCRRDYLAASHEDLGDLFAAWAKNVCHVEPGVRASRFAARLAPFPDRNAAERALVEAGAVIASGQ